MDEGLQARYPTDTRHQAPLRDAVLAKPKQPRLNLRAGALGSVSFIPDAWRIQTSVT